MKPTRHWAYLNPSHLESSSYDAPAPELIFLAQELSTAGHEPNLISSYAGTSTNEGLSVSWHLPALDFDFPVEAYKDYEDNAEPVDGPNRVCQINLISDKAYYSTAASHDHLKSFMEQRLLFSNVRYTQSFFMEKFWICLSFQTSVPFAIFSSRTHLHNHLYLDLPLTAATYSSFLGHLASAGFMELGFADQMGKYGATYLRKPLPNSYRPPLPPSRHKDAVGFSDPEEIQQYHDRCQEFVKSLAESTSVTDDDPF